MKFQNDFPSARTVEPVVFHIQQRRLRFRRRKVHYFCLLNSGILFTKINKNGLNVKERKTKVLWSHAENAKRFRRETLELVLEV